MCFMLSYLFGRLQPGVAVGEEQAGLPGAELAPHDLDRYIHIYMYIYIYIYTYYNYIQRDPNPQDKSFIRKESSTYKGFHSTFAALCS